MIVLLSASKASKTTNVKRGLVALSASALLFTASAVLGAAPSNDACPNAAVVPANGPFPYSVNVDTTSATDDAGDPSLVCNTKFPAPAPPGAVSHSVWFTFTPGITDNYQIDTLGSTPGGEYDTILGVYSGVCGSLAPLANGCNDDAPGSLQSSISLALNAGTTYTFLISGQGARDSFNQNNIVPSRGGVLKLNVKRVAINYPYKYVVPSVAHAQGQTLFVSDLNITNVDSADGSFAIQFLNHGNFGDVNAPPQQPTLAASTIVAGGSREYVDVLSTFGISFADNPYGALVIQSTRKLVIGAKTTTSGPAGGTFGQFALAFDASSELLSTNETGRLIGIRDDGTFRTNIVLVNTSLNQCGVQLEVRNNNGEIPPAGSKLPVLPPNTMVQISGVKNYFGISDGLRNASVVVKNVSSNCAVGAVAYVIDNTTQDPIAINLKK